MIRYKAVLSYDGTDYFGFQQQKPHLPTIEGEVKKALEKAFGISSKVIPAGRTDRGVHAQAQVMTFDSATDIDPQTINKGLNALLPEDIQVCDVQRTTPDFHPRYNAVSRTYIYRFAQNPVPVFVQRYVTVVSYPFDFAWISEIESIFLGRKDFINFQSQGSKAKTTLKNISEFELTQGKFGGIGAEELQDRFYTLKIKADGFLYKMVRNIVGCVWEVLRGKQSIEDLKEQFNTKNKAFHYITAPPQGLCLLKVDYEKRSLTV